MFGKGKPHSPESGTIAHQRLRELLLSERLQCSLQMIEILKRETGRTLRKYISIDEQKTEIFLTESADALLIRVPLPNRQDERS